MNYELQRHPPHYGAVHPLTETDSAHISVLLVSLRVYVSYVYKALVETRQIFVLAHECMRCSIDKEERIGFMYHIEWSKERGTLHIPVDLQYVRMFIYVGLDVDHSVGERRVDRVASLGWCTAVHFSFLFSHMSGKREIYDHDLKNIVRWGVKFKI